MPRSGRVLELLQGNWPKLAIGLYFPPFLLTEVCWEGLASLGEAFFPRIGEFLTVAAFGRIKPTLTDLYSLIIQVIKLACVLLSLDYDRRVTLLISAYFLWAASTRLLEEICVLCMCFFKTQVLWLSPSVRFKLRALTCTVLHLMFVKAEEGKTPYPSYWKARLRSYVGSVN